MCEATKQMRTILDGVSKTPTTKAILIFAETMDKSLSSIEKKQIEDRKYINNKFEEIIEMLKKQNECSIKWNDESIHRHEFADQRFKIYDLKLEKLENKLKTNCAEHQKMISTEISEIKNLTEDIRYFKKKPKLLKIIIGALIIILIYLMGNINIVNTIIQSIFK